MSSDQPRFVLDLKVSFSELLALNAAINTSIKGVQKQLDQVNNDDEERATWERRLEIAQGLRSKLSEYIDNPTFVGQSEGV